MWKTGVLVFMCLALHGRTGQCGEILTQTFPAGDWKYCGVPCYYMDFPLSVPQAVSTASIDSVEIAIWGTSRKGHQYLCMGSDCVTVDCWDRLLVSFETGPSGSWCETGHFHPDGATDFVAADFHPLGDGAAFVATRRMMGIEQIVCCLGAYTGPVYEVIDEQPDFSGVFSQESVSLRIQQVNGGPMGTGGTCIKCFDGLSTIDSVAITITYEPSMDTGSLPWGAVKALYR